MAQNLFVFIFFKKLIKIVRIKTERKFLEEKPLIFSIEKNFF